MPGLLRAERRVRPRQRRPARPNSTATSGCSTARRSGRRPAISPTTSSRSPAPTRRAEAQGHLVPARPDGPAGHRGPPDQDDLRRERVQRGLLHRRPRARRTTSSAASTTAGPSRCRCSASSAARRRPRGPIRSRPSSTGCSRWPGAGVADDPVIRQKLAWCYSKVQIMGSSAAHAHAVPRRAPPGPDGAISQALLERVPPSRHRAGDRHHGRRRAGREAAPSSAFRPTTPGAPNSSASWIGTFLNARAGTIYAGSVADPAQHHRRDDPRLPKEPRPHRSGELIAACRGRVDRRCRGASPSLWVTALRQARRTARRAGGSGARSCRCRRASTSIPPRHAVRRRCAPPEPDDVVNYLRWCREWDEGRAESASGRAPRTARIRPGDGDR